MLGMRMSGKCGRDFGEGGNKGKFQGDLLEVWDLERCWAVLLEWG